MSSFRDKILKPLIEGAAQKLKAAGAVPDVTARADAVLDARDENKKSFSKARNRQLLKMAGFGALMLAGAAAGLLGVMTATSLVATLAGTSGAAIPLAVAGFVTEALGGLGMAIAGVRGLETSRSEIIVTAQADAALAQLAATYPVETAKSPRAAAFLKSAFNATMSAAPQDAGPAPGAPAAAAAPKP